LILIGVIDDCGLVDCGLVDCGHVAIVGGLVGLNCF